MFNDRFSNEAAHEYRGQRFEAAETYEDQDQPGFRNRAVVRWILIFALIVLITAGVILF